MNQLNATDAGPDRARLLGHVRIRGALDATESGGDTLGSTLMQRLARVLQPLAAGGAFPGQNTAQPPTYPFVVFFRVIATGNVSFDGPSPMKPTRVQVDCLSLRYGEAAAISVAVRRALVSNFSVGELSEQDFPPDTTTVVYRCMVDATLWAAF